MHYSWIFVVCSLAYSTTAETDFQGYNPMTLSYRKAPYPPANKPYPPSKPYPPANAPYPPAASGTGIGATGTGAGVTGAGVTGAGITGAGVSGAGVTGFGAGVTGAGVGPGFGAAGFGPGIGPGPGPGFGPIPGPGLGPGFIPGPGFGFPPFFPAGPFGPNPALLGLSPLCAKLEVLRSYVSKLIHPVLVGAMGFLVFFLVKSLFLPYLGIFAKALEARSGALGESNLDLIAATVYKAISSRVCMERVVCQLGRRTKDYSFTKSVVRAIEQLPLEPQKYLKIFKDVVSGREDNCQRFTCKKTVSSTSLKQNQLKEQNKIPK